VGGGGGLYLTPKGPRSPGRRMRKKVEGAPYPVGNDNKMEIGYLSGRVKRLSEEGLMVNSEEQVKEVRNKGWRKKKPRGTPSE